MALGWSCDTKAPCTQPSVSRRAGRAERSEKAPSSPTRELPVARGQEEGCKKPLTVLFTFLASRMKSGELEFSYVSMNSQFRIRKWPLKTFWTGAFLSGRQQLGVRKGSQAWDRGVAGPP